MPEWYPAMLFLEEITPLIWSEGGQWSRQWAVEMIPGENGDGVLCCCGNVGYNVSVSIEEAEPEQLRGELSQLLQDLSPTLIC